MSNTKQILKSNCAEPQVILVDPSDREIGSANKLYVHEKGLLHRAFSVFLFRDNNGTLETLMQQRAASKYHCPNLWSNTCCSHPSPGESVITAAERRVYEELGLNCDLYNINLNKIGSFCYRVSLDNSLIEHEYDHVLVGKVDENFSLKKIQYNKDEIQNLEWVSLKKLTKSINSSVNKYTPWLAMALYLLLSEPKKLLKSLYK